MFAWGGSGGKTDYRCVDIEFPLWGKIKSYNLVGNKVFAYCHFIHDQFKTSKK